MHFNPLGLKVSIFLKLIDGLCGWKEANARVCVNSPECLCVCGYVPVPVCVCMSVCMYVCLCVRVFLVVHRCAHVWRKRKREIYFV